MISLHDLKFFISGKWERERERLISFCIFLLDPLVSDLEPHANNFLVAYSNTLGIEVGEKRLGGIFVPTLLELLRDYYET